MGKSHLLLSAETTAALEQLRTECERSCFSFADLAYCLLDDLCRAAASADPTCIIIDATGAIEPVIRALTEWRNRHTGSSVAIFALIDRPDDAPTLMKAGATAVLYRQHWTGVCSLLSVARESGRTGDAGSTAASFPQPTAAGVTTEIADERLRLVRILRSVVEIADELLAETDLQTIYRRVVEGARERLGVERATIFLRDGNIVRGTFGTDMQRRTTDERSHQFLLEDKWRERFRLRNGTEPRWALVREPYFNWEDGRLVPRGEGWIAITPIQTTRQPVAVFCNDTAISGAPCDPLQQEILAVYAALVANVIERKWAEAEYETLYTAIRQAAEAVLVADADGLIRFVNPAFERITGFSREEAVGRPAETFDGETVSSDTRSVMRKALQNRKIWKGRLTRRRKDGQLFVADEIVAPVIRADGRFDGFIAVAQDVTRESQWEEAVRTAQKMETIARLAGGLAHDFNNLLTSIMGYAELLRDTLAPSHPARSDAEEIIRAAQRAAKLTRQLLVIGQKQFVQLRPIDLNQALVNMQAALLHTLGPGIALELKFSEEVPLISGDLEMLEHAVLQLAHNARDAMPQGGRFELETAALEATESSPPMPGAPPGRYAVLIARDTGSGIPDHIRARLFEPFFTTKATSGSKGLGLATVYGIVRRFGGFIDIQSPPGAGAVFRILFPAARSIEEVEKETPAPSGHCGRRESILLVEDEPALRSVLARGLRAAGYQVWEASCPREAMRIFAEREGLFDLVVTDVIMPETSGFELAKRLLAQRASLPILFISGFEQTPAGEKSAPANARIIHKPFSIEALAAEIRRALDENRR